MKKLIAAAALLASVPAFALDVGVSIGILQPGLHGRIDIGQQYSPAVVPQPVYVSRPVLVAPPHAGWAHGHHNHWRQPAPVVVYGQDGWGRPHAVAERRWDRRDDGYHRRDHRQHDRYDRRDDRRDDRHDRRRGHD